MRGFTLIELILVIAISATLAALAVPTIGQFSNRTQIDATETEIISALRLAQAKAMAVEQDSKFGVYFDNVNQKFYIFRGLNFGDNPSENIEYNYPNVINVAQSFTGNQADFEKLFGTTTDTGNIVITNNIGQTRTINVSSVGKIEYAE
ncbi:MAG: prepilin-type N-terminal cleavage/methylation domain-containing protein [Patescibacteria group bacterium]|jgi:prepilin-type N-terminal cleavage/methylation domain-containing protein